MQREYKKDTARDLWDRVDELRGRRSVRELAEESGIIEGSLQVTRASGTLPKLPMLYALSKTLGTTMEWLYAGENITETYDAPLFQRLSQSQDLVDICEALVSTATQEDIELCKRVLGISRKVRIERGGGQLMILRHRTTAYRFYV